MVGLNLDFVTLNVVGFFCYSMYNCGLRFIPGIKVGFCNYYTFKLICARVIYPLNAKNYLFQTQYFAKHVHGVMPVQIQDVVFALHALFASCLTAIEALIFDVCKLSLC